MTDRQLVWEAVASQGSSYKLDSLLKMHVGVERANDPLSRQLLPSTSTANQKHNMDFYLNALRSAGMDAEGVAAQVAAVKAKENPVTDGAKKED